MSSPPDRPSKRRRQLSDDDEAVPSSSSQPLLLGGFPLEAARLGLPPGLPPPEQARRQAAVLRELTHQALHPPVLPPTQVRDLPPKPYVKEFLKMPDNIAERHRRRIEAANNSIAAEHQRVERERNNQAAKKSRQTRMESLSNTRRLLNEKTAECAWFRIRLLALGGCVDDWVALPGTVREGIVREVDERVRAVDAHMADVKKKEDARKRAERIKRRACMEEQQQQQQQQQYVDEWPVQMTGDIFHG